MKRFLIHLCLLAGLIGVGPLPAGALTDPALARPEVHEQTPDMVFINTIPAIARQFIGIPFEWGGNPQVTGTSDNSYLFFSIYSLAAQKAGFAYHSYLPMKFLLKRTHEIQPQDLRNGDLMVLRDNHAAMVYKIEPNGRIHLIYASGKRRRVIAFNSDNLVYQIYWMENLKGFYRLNENMLRP